MANKLYDENNEGLAFYSIKQGHSIEAPIYNCKAWQTENGVNIEFPYTPTTDLVVYALNSTYASQLYKFYGVDSAVYPYVAVYAYKYLANLDSLSIEFSSEIDWNTTSSFRFKSALYGSASGRISSDTDITSIENIIALTTQKISSVSLMSSPYNHQTSGTYAIYTNFECNLETINHINYRLDE